MDALRADAIGLHGSSGGASPTLDRLGAEGVVFRRHFSVAPNTPISTRALFTGQLFLDATGPPPEGTPTLAELFRGAGFRTGAVSSNPYLSESQGLMRGFDQVEFLEFREDFRSGAPPTPNDSADQVHRAALAWLDGLEPEVRALLYLHTLHPHNPYTPPDPFPARFAQSDRSAIDGGTKTLVGIRDGAIDPTPEDQGRLRDLYLANLAYNDQRLAELLIEIERRYEPGEVLLVVTSDHGEELFDHGGVLHGYTLYDEMIHVPLIFWWPGYLAPRTVDGLTDALDLHVTLRELVERAPGAGVDGGESLWGAMVGADRRRRTVRFAATAGNRRIAMARSESWKLILAPNRGLEWGMGRGRGANSDAEYAFRIATDPDERINLAGTASLELAWLRSRLLACWARWSERRPDSPPTEVDEETRRRLRALGYME
jgi:arylsulfatase A-like enzyme